MLSCYLVYCPAGTGQILIGGRRGTGAALAGCPCPSPAEQVFQSNNPYPAVSVPQLLQTFIQLSQTLPNFRKHDFHQRYIFSPRNNLLDCMVIAIRTESVLIWQTEFHLHRILEVFDAKERRRDRLRAKQAGTNRL